MILEVQNGCFGYPKQPVILENINLRLEEGHILAILGPNGIGKTTLLKCMIGLLPWHSGKTLLYGKDMPNAQPLSGMILVAFGSARLVPGRSSSLGNVPTMWCVVSVRSRESFS